MKLYIEIFLCSIVFRSIGSDASKPCVRKNYPGPEPMMVCVCNSTYCDEFPDLDTLSATEANIYVTSKSGKRFEKSVGVFQPVQNVSQQVTIKIIDWIQYQPVIGFGGAFTDAVDVNLNSLNESTRDNLLNAYFGKGGIGYSLGRVPIGSTDFSVRKYSYDDVINDFNLVNFSLTTEDFTHKIPNILKAINLTNNGLNLFATPWSAPGWMKTNGDMLGRGQIKGDIDGPYYEMWSRYLLRFFEEYEKQGINFWGMTVQNKPNDFLDTDPNAFQKMNLNPEMQRDFIKGILGPMLRNSNVTRYIKLMIHDDDRKFLPGDALMTLNDEEAAKYVDGVGVQWYDDVPWDSMDDLVTINKATNGEKFILYTEACNGYLDFLKGPKLGDWSRGVSYANDIIQVFQNYVSGWVDFNLCLNEQGGPSWVGNYVDSPIIVNATADEFYKQPMYYVLGHFSKFVRINSKRVAMNIVNSQKGLNGLAFTTPSNLRVVVLQNTQPNITYNVGIEDPYIGMDVYLNIQLEPNSIVTVVWNKPNIINE